MTGGSERHGTPRFRLVRQDDNGGAYEVARFTSRCEAGGCAQAFEARGHKQTYRVEDERG